MSTSDATGTTRSALLPPLRRAGVALGLSWSQLGLVAAGVVVILIANIAGGLGQVAAAIWLWLPLVLVGAGSWRGRSFTERIGVEMLFAVRKATGKTRARVDVGGHRPASRMEIPGAVGERTHLLDLEAARVPGACLVWDAAAGTATAVLRFTSRSWNLTAPEEQTARCDAFAHACRSIATMEGVVRVTTYARTIPRTTDHLAIDPGRSLSDFAAGDYERLLDSGALGDAPYRDILVAVTVAKEKARAEIQRNGGGKVGVGAVLSTRVAQLRAHLAGTGVEMDGATWLSGDALRGACRLVFDPVAAVWLDPRTGIDSNYLVVSALEEHREHVTLDSAVARTWWIERWPNEAVAGGFLAQLIGTGAFWHTVTQVWVASDLAASEKRLANDESSSETWEAVNRSLKRNRSAARDRETRALEQRRADLTAGYGDVRYSVFVTGIAPKATDLDAIGRWIGAQVPGAVVNPLRAQQWAALTQAALPLGITNRGA